MKTLILSILSILLFSAVSYGQAPFTACNPGTIPLHGSGQVPNFDARINGATTCLLGIHLTNTDPSNNAVVTLHDAANLFIYVIPVLANSSVDANWPNGLEFDNALFWQASWPSVVASYIAVQ